ncbi:MAG: DUF4124 domain-containing protein [Proteobacteria bacterium]|nr:DUF4124 domain-containing protein [Pseudomonadota bacterium]MBU4470319.1 DUF4124 domain-containing protein [Pseudomonadota bacterium]
MATSISARMYSWTDENGIKHFSNTPRTLDSTREIRTMVESQGESADDSYHGNGAFSDGEIKRGKAEREADVSEWERQQEARKRQHEKDTIVRDINSKENEVQRMIRGARVGDHESYIKDVLRIGAKQGEINRAQRRLQDQDGGRPNGSNELRAIKRKISDLEFEQEQQKYDFEREKRDKMFNR